MPGSGKCGCRGASVDFVAIHGNCNANGSDGIQTHIRAVGEEALKVSGRTDRTFLLFHYDDFHQGWRPTLYY